MCYACFGALITVPLNSFNQDSEGFDENRMVVPDGNSIVQGNLGFLSDILDCSVKLVFVFKISNALKIFQISFGTCQRFKGRRGSQPHATACARVGLAFVNLDAEVAGMLGVFWSESNHNVVVGLHGYYKLFHYKSTTLFSQKVKKVAWHIPGIETKNAQNSLF